MIYTAGLFDSTKLRNLWFDTEGLLRAYRKPKPGRGTARPRRKIRYGLAKAVVFGTLAAATAPAFATAAPMQMSLTWPTLATEASTRQFLEQSLKGIRQLKAHWSGQDAAAPVERSISAAHYILPQLPELSGDATAGVDSDGNVFLKFTRGERVALLTIEPRAMHLAYMQPGTPTLYKDDEQFNGKVIPANIKKVLDGFGK